MAINVRELTLTLPTGWCSIMLTPTELRALDDLHKQAATVMLHLLLGIMYEIFRLHEADVPAAKTKNRRAALLRKEECGEDEERKALVRLQGKFNILNKFRQASLAGMLVLICPESPVTFCPTVHPTPCTA